MSTSQQNAPDSTTQNVSSKLDTSMPEEKTPETAMPVAQDTEMDLSSFVNGDAIQKMMSSEGPTVKAVVLRADGSVDEIDYDTTPKKHLVKEILGADPTIIGEWHDLQVILVKGRIESLNVPMNQHKLRWPYASECCRGDILLYRVNEEATPVDFTAKEYTEFASKTSEDAQLEAEFNAAQEKLEAEQDAMADDDMDDDDDDDCDMALDEAVMRAQVENMVKRQFVNKFGRDPSEDELASFSEAVMGQFLGSMEAGIPEGDDEEDAFEDDDEEYNPEEDEDQGDDEQEEEQIMAELVDENEEDDACAPREDEAEDKEQDDSAFQMEFAAALDGVRELAIAQRQQILEAAKAQYEAETGEVADEETLSQAFDLLKVKMNPNGSLEEEEEDDEDETKDASENPEATEDNDDVDADDEDDEDVEQEMVLSEEELRSEIAAAFEAVRERGRMDGQKIAQMVSDTFYEINGREADSSDIAAVFSRIKDKLAEEAAEELIYDDDENTDAPAAEPAEDVDTDKREELVSYARTLVTRQMAMKARQKFVELANREPSVEEFDDLLITLATTRFLDADFNESEASDDDYNPNAAGEQLMEEKDKQIEEEECAEVDTADAFDVLGGYDAARSPSKKKPVAFFSPVRTKKQSSDVNYSVLDQKLMERAVQHFEKIHNRQPTEEESEKLGRFLTTDGLDYELSDDEDYDPTKDDSCNVVSDNLLTKAFDAEFEKEKTEDTNATAEAAADVISDN